MYAPSLLFFFLVLRFFPHLATNTNRHHRICKFASAQDASRRRESLCIFVCTCGSPRFRPRLNQKAPSSLRLCVKVYNPELTTATQSVTLFPLSPSFSSPASRFISSFAPSFFFFFFLFAASLANPRHWYSMFFVAV